MRAAVLQAILVTMVLANPINALAQAPESAPAYRYVLTSAKANLATEAFAISQRDLPELDTGAWSVRKTALHGGKQEGAELITIDNGTLRIVNRPSNRTFGRGLGECRN